MSPVDQRDRAARATPGGGMRRITPDERRERLQRQTARVRRTSTTRGSSKQTGGARSRPVRAATNGRTPDRSSAAARSRAGGKAASSSRRTTPSRSAPKPTSRSRTVAYADDRRRATISISTRPDPAKARSAATRTGARSLNRSSTNRTPAEGTPTARKAAAASAASVRRAGATTGQVVADTLGGFIHRTSPPKGPRLLSTPLKTEPKHTRRRLIAVLVLVAMLFAVVVVKLVNLQLLDPGQYLALGSSQRFREQVLPADRGTIFDRNGVELALSLPQKSVFVDPKLVTDPAGEATKLASVLKLDPADIEQKMRAANRFGYIARFVPDDVAKQVEALGLAGVAFVEEPKRYAPSSEVAGSIVGSVDTEGTGISGVEKRYGSELAGTPGKLVLEQSPDGRTIAVGEHQLVPARQGDDLVLSIDRSMQYEVERVLTDQVNAVGAKGGTVVISKPDTGEILSMVNVTRDAKDQVHQDGSAGGLTSVYEPGSVMKLVSVAGALEDQKVTPDTVLSLPSVLQIADGEFSDAEERGPVAWPVSKIIEQSSNVGTIKIAQLLGKQRVYDYMTSFGFGAKTAIDFPNEQSGVVPKPEKWWDTTMGTVPIRQGVSVTPVQMLAAYNTIANGGTYRPPTLVQATIDANGVRHDVAPEGSHRVVSQATSDKLNVILRSVVAQGTGTKAAVQGYTVAGKTGTARKPQPGGGYTAPDGQVKYQSTFVGFAPAESPAVSVFVMIDEPAGGQIFGGLVAAPVFAKLTEFALRQLGVPPPATDLPAGGGPANSDAQARMAAQVVPADAGPANPFLDLLPAVQIGPDGRVRGVPAGSFIPFPELKPGPSAPATGGAPVTTGSSVPPATTAPPTSVGAAGGGRKT